MFESSVFYHCVYVCNAPPARSDVGRSQAGRERDGKGRKGLQCWLRSEEASSSVAAAVDGMWCLVSVVEDGAAGEGECCV